MSDGLDGVVLMGHGSRDGAAAAEFGRLAAEVAALLGVPTLPGVLEFPGTLPSIQAAFDACAALGCRRVAAVPAVLFAGGHGSQDLPEQVRCARARLPWLEIGAADLLGIDDGLLDCLIERAEAALAGLPPSLPDETMLLLVTSGSARREANADVFKAARLLADRAGARFSGVEVAFLRLSRPYLQDAALRCARLGARRVLVLPLFLTTGLLARRVPRKLVWLRQRLPCVEFVEVPHLGVDPVVVRLLAQRAREAFTEPLNNHRIATPVRLAQERCRPLPRARPGPPRSLVAEAANGEYRP
jgi:sirohydrochlorin cobaltochelatase